MFSKLHLCESTPVCAFNSIFLKYTYPMGTLILSVQLAQLNELKSNSSNAVPSFEISSYALKFRMTEK
jgi:hypothetical protein